MPISRCWILALALSLATIAARSDAIPGRTQDEPEARRIMLDIEHAQREGSRLFSMDVTLTYDARHTSRRNMLGLVSTDGRGTRLLYVVTAPREIRGSALLILDPIDVLKADRMFINLPSLHAFREVEAASMSLLVPGTGMTYEDSRGWIPTDRYRFRTVINGPEERTIEAIPRTDSLIDAIGSSRLLIRVDPARRVVTGVVFYDRAGSLTRTYEAAAFERVGARWYPTHVTTEQRVQLLVARISYRYADLAEAPPAALFRPAGEPTPFLERLIEWRDRSGYAAKFPDSSAVP